MSQFNFNNFCEKHSSKMSAVEIIQGEMEVVEASGEELFCEYCGLTFVNRFLLKKHIDLEHFDEHLCETCKATFTTKADLIFHQKFDHNLAKPYMCDICSSSFRYENDMKQHTLQVHEKLKHYKCDICPWAFGCAGNLKKHISFVHEKERRFECQYCNKKIGMRKELLSHILIVHKGARPYKCNICPKAFGRVGTLIKHRRFVHEKERRFECQQCNRKTVSRFDLANHIKFVHEGIRPFSCNKCEYVCTTSSNLNKHHLVMHTNLKAELPCTECGKLFKTKDKVKGHFEQVHGNKKHKQKRGKTNENEPNDSLPPQVADTKDVSLNKTFEASKNHDTEINLLGDLVNDYNMIDELGETLELIKNLDNSQNSKMAKKNDVQPKITDEKPMYQLDDNIKPTKMSLRQSEFQDSGIDSFNNPKGASTPKNPMNKAKLHSKKSSLISTIESTSNILEIYSSSSTKEPITKQQWFQIEEFIIEKITTAITTGEISPLQVKILNSGYDDSKKMGFIQAKDTESKHWYQTKVAQLSLDGTCFRAWSEHENPEIFILRLALPGKLNTVKEKQVLPLLVSFNPQLKTHQFKVEHIEMVEKVGRFFYLKTSQDAFEFVKEKNWKLDFLLGEVKLAKVDEPIDL